MTLYYLKIIEGFSMDVQFDSVQGLNLFHKKAQSLVNSIDGINLNRQTIHVERTLDIIPLLYLKDGAPFSQYKYILFNHIQSIINFYALRNWDQSFVQMIPKPQRVNLRVEKIDSISTIS